jgi:diguanylate cyclase (GGDEF)-like protein
MAHERDVAAELKAVADRFLLQLRQELSQLQALLRNETGPAGPALLRELRERCHRLSGSSASFGHTAFADELRQAEHWLQARIRDCGEGYAELRRRLLTLQPPSQAAALPAPAELTDALPAATEYACATPERSACLDLPASGGATRQQLEALLTDLGFELSRESGPENCGLRVHWLDEDCSAPPPTAVPHQHLLVLAERDDLQSRLCAVRALADGFFSLPLDALAFERRIDLLMPRTDSQPFRVLLVDDDAALLQHNCSLLRAAGLQAFALDHPLMLLGELERLQPDVLVLDMNMPGCDGLELAKAVRFSDAWLQMPIIYLSADRSDERQRAAMASAGEQFLVKPVAPETLVAQVLGRARRARSLAQGLGRDGLTGLLRHAEIKEQLGQALARAGREASTLSIALLDLDHFKRTNDRFGHAAGDRVLRCLARLLSSRSRRGDATGRYGGEEFLLVLPSCPLEAAAERVDRLRIDFAATSVAIAGQSIHSSFSAGVAQWDGEETPEALLSRADQALYAAKAGGRNRVERAP